jgi:hypothetical protein
MRSLRLIAAGTLLAAAASPALAQDLGERLQVHGSLNAAYAQSDSLPSFGIPKTGTTNYRAFVLQFRYQLSDDDAIVTQFLNRRLGTSPLQAANPDVQVNWAYWQRKHGDWTLRVGRNPMPRGFFNETRFIGTVLPLFRTGASVYGETLETIDGLVVSRRADLGAGFNLEAHAFGGGSRINVLFPSGTTVSVVDSRLEKFFGGQVFVTTPVPGTRLGGFVGSYEIGNVNPYRQNTYLLSAEAVYDRAYIRAEGTRFTTAKSTIEGRSYSEQQASRVDYLAGYVHAGVKLLPTVTLISELNSARTRIFLPEIPVPGVGPTRFPDAAQADRDLAIGASWAITPTTIVKLEGHEARGYNYDVPVIGVNPTFIGVPPALRPATLINPWRRNRYVIASLAVSF